MQSAIRVAWDHAEPRHGDEVEALVAGLRQAQGTANRRALRRSSRDPGNSRKEAGEDEQEGRRDRQAVEADRQRRRSSAVRNSSFDATPTVPQRTAARTTSPAPARRSGKGAWNSDGGHRGRTLCTDPIGCGPSPARRRQGAPGRGESIGFTGRSLRPSPPPAVKSVGGSLPHSVADAWMPRVPGPVTLRRHRLSCLR